MRGSETLYTMFRAAALEMTHPETAPSSLARLDATRSLAHGGGER